MRGPNAWSSRRWAPELSPRRRKVRIDRRSAVADDIRFDRKFISSYSPINSLAASDAKAPPHRSHTLACGRETHRIVRKPTLCAHAPASPRRAESSRAFPFCPSRRLRRRARILIGSLKLEHQLDQLLFAQVLQISPVHRPNDLEIDAHGKGVGNCSAAPACGSPIRPRRVASPSSGANREKAKR